MRAHVRKGRSGCVPPPPHPHPRDGCAASVALHLIFWNETKGDWDDSGVARADDKILQSGNNCTFIGYATHFTSFTIGSINVELNAIDTSTVRQAALASFSCLRRPHAPLTPHVRGVDGVGHPPPHPAQDSSLLANLASSPGGKMTLAVLCALLGVYLIALIFTIRVRTHSAVPAPGRGGS